MTAHSGKTVLQGWVRSMTAFGDEQKSMCLRALIKGRFVFWIYACPKLVLVVTRSCPLEGTWPTKRKGWGAPKWQSLWKGNSVRDDFLTVWCLNRQAQLNIICMNYYGLGWHFGRWGQFGMKEWFSMGQNHPHVGVTVIGSAPGLQWAEPRVIMPARHSRFQHSEDSTTSHKAFRCLLENYTGEKPVS